MASSKSTDYIKIISGSVQNKTYSFAIFTIVVVIVLLVGAIRPTLLTITRISRDIREKKHINEQLELKLNSLGQLSSQYATIEFQAQYLPQIFPTQSNFSLFMANVEQIAKDNGYVLNSISFGSIEEVDMKLNVLKPWSARLAVTGNKSNIVRLLSAFEEMPMYPIVNKVSFSNNDKNNGQTVYSIELIIFRVDDPNFYD
jgi:Tfp pilus assembly protein PilO